MPSTRTQSGQKRRPPTARAGVIVLVVGLFATLAVAGVAWRDHREAVAAELRSDVEIGTRSFQFGVADYVDLVIALQAFVEGSGGAPDSLQLRLLLKRLARGQKAVQVLGYLPRVRREERAAFEAAAREAGFNDYAIVEHTLGNRDIPAADRDEYFPTLVFEPFEKNAKTVGFDAASEPVRRKLMEKARDTGEPAATALTTLVDTPDLRGFIVVAPIYSTHTVPETVEARRAGLLGYVFGVFRLGEMADDVAEQTRALHDFDQYFFEGTSAEAASLVYSRRSGRPEYIGKPASFSPQRLARGIKSTITVVDRSWTIISVPADGESFDPGPITWAVAGVGGIGSLWFAVHLIGSARRTRELVQLAERLTRSRSELEREIAQKELAQSQLSVALKIVEGSSTAISRWSFAPGATLPRLEYISPNFGRFGHPVEEVLADDANFLRIVYPGDREALERAMSAAVKEKSREAHSEFRLIGKDGRVIWVEGLMTFEWDAATGGGSAVGILRDVTERKTAEEAAKANTERLEHFQRLTVGREHDMLRLKLEVNGLLQQLGRPARYAAPGRVAELEQGARPRLEPLAEKTKESA